MYVKYLGFFDGNPANLYQLPPTEQAVRYLDYMGGADAIVTKAQSSFADGDYRWVAEVLNHVVMADQHVNARALLADTYEQLVPIRVCTLAQFLCAAPWSSEGLPESRSYAASAGMAAGIPIENLFQIMVVRLLPEAASVDMRCITVQRPRQGIPATD